MIERHTDDARGALRRWYDSIVAGGRFAGWLVEVHPGGAHARAGAWVDFVREDVAAHLCAWPSGCIATYTMRIPEDPEPVCGHVEVDSEEGDAAGGSRPPNRRRPRSRATRRLGMLREFGILF